MKIIKHYYHVILIQMAVWFIITVAQSYLSLMNTAALSCRCPSCALLDAISYDSLIALMIVMPIFSVLEKAIHSAKIRLYLHAIIVLVAWGGLNGRLWLERSQCDEVSAPLTTHLLLDFALPMAVALAIYLPVYRWARKTIVVLNTAN